MMDSLMSGLGNRLAARRLGLLPLLYTIIAAAGVYCFADGDPAEPNAPSGPMDDQTIEATEDHGMDSGHEVEDTTQGVEASTATTLEDLLGEAQMGVHEECDTAQMVSILQAEIDKLENALIQKEIAMAEAERKEKKATETIAQLEAEKLDLESEERALRESLEEMGNLVIKQDKENDALLIDCEREREAQKALQAENDKLKNTITESEMSTEEAEKKYQTALESIAHLESQNSTLAYQVKTLRDSVQEMGILLSEANIESDRLLNERVQAEDIQAILQVENDKLKKTLVEKEKLLKVQVSLIEAENKNEKAAEFIAQLEAKSLHLTSQVQTLHEDLQDLCTMMQTGIRLAN